MCPKPSDSKNPLSKQSHFEKLEGIPGLFNALLDDPDDDKWKVYTFPVDYDSSLYGPNSQDSQFYMRKIFELKFVNFKFINSVKDSSDHDLQSVTDLNTVSVNCSVTYMSPCMSMIKW